MRNAHDAPTSRESVSDELEDLLHQALETEIGGVEVYRTALQCVQNDELRCEWRAHLEQTQAHVARLHEVFAGLGLDPNVDTPGRRVVRTLPRSLVQAMLLALDDDGRGTAERVAAECIVLAETKDHLNWSLLGELVKDRPGMHRRLVEAVREIESEEDEHLYHTQGWARELWLEALGVPAQLPPPEEEQQVESAVEAALAKESRRGGS
jgi:hypothetical protein